jgi:hypothetical protein
MSLRDTTTDEMANFRESQAETGQGRGKQGKVDGQVGTTHIRKLSCCQDVIVPLSEKKDLDRYASCCPHDFWT